MNQIEKIENEISAAKARLASALERVMSDPDSTEEEFEYAFRKRDIIHVESKFNGMTDDERQDAEAEMRWETRCGCNGSDSPYHTYFGF